MDIGPFVAMRLGKGHDPSGLNPPEVRCAGVLGVKARRVAVAHYGRSKKSGTTCGSCARCTGGWVFMMPQATMGLKSASSFRPGTASSSVR